MRSLTLRTVLTWLDAGFRKGRFVLNNSKQKHKKFLNFHPNSLENEIFLLPKGWGGGVGGGCRGALRERNVTLRLFLFKLTSDFFGFCYKFLAILNQVSLINLIKILYFFFSDGIFIFSL